MVSKQPSTDILRNRLRSCQLFAAQALHIEVHLPIHQVIEMGTFLARLAHCADDVDNIGHHTIHERLRIVASLIEKLEELCEPEGAAHIRSHLQQFRTYLR